MNWATLMALLCLALPQAGQTGSGEARQSGNGQPSGMRLAAWQRPSDEDRERARLRIGITKEQQTQIEALYAETNKQMQAIYARLRDLYRQLDALYDQYEFDRQQALAVRREIFGLRRRIMDLHAENEEKLRRVLNKDQFDRMRALLKEERASRHERRPGRRLGPPPPPGKGA